MYYYQNYSEEFYRQQENLIRKIQKAINGEYSAVQCYEKIAALAPDKKTKDQIEEIRKDEMRHLREFSAIYTRLTGNQPKPKTSEGCPNTFRAGLDFAFKDEQETTDFYHEISREATDQIIKETFRNAAADEQQHAVWFLYYLTAGR